MKNYHIIKVMGLGATNTKPARVKIISERFSASVTIPFTNNPGSISPALTTAIEWLEKRGFEIIGQGEGTGHYYLISETFETIK